ncbi:hypothetical protein [Amycolatopsis sp. lyj-346]|uniref:hypothetical protein n=1 Tax=Amycolatopsis sp. lyj-346 TaxID=2789289 RepID=UPI00397D1C1D
MWPDENDLRFAEHPEYVRLCRVLLGLRRLRHADSPAATSGATLTRDTQRLVDVLEAAQGRLFLLVAQLRDNTATAAEQHKAADELDELLDLLRSHADDTDAGIIPAPRNPERECA